LPWRQGGFGPAAGRVWSGGREGLVWLQGGFGPKGLIQRQFEFGLEAGSICSATGRVWSGGREGLVRWQGGFGPKEDECN
jgi:hypothetical protein